MLLVNGLFYLLSVEDGSTVLQVSSLSWEALDAQIQMEKEQGSDTLSHSLFSITTAAGMSYFRCADPEDRYSLESTECLLLVIGNSVGDVGTKILNSCCCLTDVSHSLSPSCGELPSCVHAVW